MIIIKPKQMIVTKQQQEKILDKYINENHNTDECSGFVDGINATLELVDRLIREKLNQPGNGCT